MKHIIIISLEGLESNSEINFFNGLACHFNDSLIIKTIALGKTKDQRDKIELKKKMIKKRLFEELSKEKENIIFFIGDGDKREHIDSMERTMEIIKDLINDNNTFCVQYPCDDILTIKNGNFESLINSIVTGVKFKHKETTTGSNWHLFNIIINNTKCCDKLTNNNKLKKCLKELFKNTEWKEIFDEI